MPTLSRTYSITSSIGPVHKTVALIRPDGGWGWAVVFGSFFISFITDGFSYTTGVLYEKFLHVYGESESVTSMFTALMTGIISVIGPVAAGLSQTYGCRSVTLAGALIASFSMAMSVVFDSSIYCHILTLGLGLGIGLGLMFLPQMTIVTDWFDRRISLAMGIAVAGSGFGIASFALVSQEMFNRFDWHHVMLFLSVIMFLCVFFALTFSSPPEEKKSLEQMKSKNKECSETGFEMLKSAINNSFNFRMLRDIPFLYLIMSNSLGCAVYYVPFMLTIDRMVRAGYGTANDGAMLMVYFGISNGFSRFIAGYFADLKCINRTVLYGSSVFAMGVIVALTTFANSVEEMNILYILLGTADGIHACLGTVILVDEFGSERVYNTYGILLLFEGIASIIGPPMINYLTVFDKSYRCSLLACSAILSFSGALCGIFPCLPFRKRKHTIIEQARNGLRSISIISSNDNSNQSNNNNNNCKHKPNSSNVK